MSPLPGAPFRAVFRGARLIAHLFTGMALVLLVKLDFSRRIAPEPLTRWWNARLLKILHVRLRLHGMPLRGQRLIVCNHISWLDIPVLAACELTRFVSKAEVGSWPIAGWLANAAGTFYIRRGAGGTKQLIQAIAAHLGRGGSATVFPEGTTTEGGDMLKFQPRLFAAAIDSGSPVQPLALRYSRAANGDNIAAFVGEQTLTDNLFRLLLERELTVELHYCAPLPPQAGQDRAALAQAAHAAIRAVIAPGQLSGEQVGEQAAQARESLAA
jgi:1-acyl-sn-glycerol-3-phosphate acyltransferase